MFGLAQISKMNTLAEAAKLKFLARSLNTPGGHAKDSEKGRRVTKKKMRPARPDWVGFDAEDR